MLDRILPNDLLSSERLPPAARDRVARARTEVRRQRFEGPLKLWTAETRGLERLEALLDRGPTSLTERLRESVTARLDEVTRPPIDGYADLNAKTAAQAVRELELVDLARVERFERAHKDRKTVYRAIEKARRDRLEALELAA